MPRIRSLKIGFFTNELLCELSPWHRLLFAGLWLLADREGRLEDRPRRIKATLFPYDEMDVDRLLTELAEKGFVVRYTADGAGADGARYLAIPTFAEHQRPKTDEYPSAYPAPSLMIPRNYARTPLVDRDRDRDVETETEGESQLDGPGALQRVWNTLTTPPIPRCQELSSSRRRHVKARLTERPLAAWEAICQRIEQSPFCRGENDRGWLATFDWLVGSPDVAVKVLEGKYDNRASIVMERKGCGHEPPCRTMQVHTAKILEEGRPVS